SGARHGGVCGLGIVDSAADRNAGIVDEDVEVTEIPGHVADELFDVHRRGLVGLIGAGVDASGLQFRDDTFGLFGRGDITDGDVGTFVGKGAGGSRANAARAA